MEFKVMSSEFKKAVDRTMAVAKPRSYLAVYSAVKIFAENDRVIVSGANGEEFADITVPAKVTENGEAYVQASDIVKVYGVDGYITVEAKDGMFTVKNNKKCRQVPTCDHSAVPEKPEFPNLAAMKIKEDELLFTLSNLICMTGNDERKAVLAGFNINTDNGYITACDGHRLGMRKIKAEIYNDNLNITVPDSIYKSLKKIGDSKSDDYISVFVQDGGEHICVEGSDYTYISKLYAEEYLNVQRIVDVSPNYQFRVSSKELLNIAKEYGKAVKGGKNDIDQKPMGLIKCGGELCASIVQSSYATADILETVDKTGNVPDNYVYFVVPQYIADAMSVFDGEEIKVYGTKEYSNNIKSYISGIFFENEDFKCMILPVRCESAEAIVNKTKEMVDKI